MDDLESCQDGLGLSQAKPKLPSPAKGESAKEEPAPPPPKKRRTSANKAGEATEKKCKRCKKMKLCSDFYQGQAQCTDCSQGLRNLQNVAKRSGEAAWLKGLDDAEVDQLLQAYNKEKAKCEKERTKVKFNMSLYRERTIHASGYRKEARRRMMTEDYFYSWAKTSEGGTLSASQAQRKWEEYESDPSTVREGEGKSLKLAIPIFEDIVDYDDVGASREIEQQSRLGNKLSKDQLAEKNKVLVLAGGRRSAPEQDLAHAVMMDQDSSGTLIPKLSALPTKSKKGLAPEAGDSDDDKGQREPGQASASGSSAPDGNGKPQENKWFDAVAERAKADRKFGQDLQKAVKRLATMDGQMKEAMDIARAEATTCGSAVAVTEMKILDTRNKALSLVRTGTPEELETHINSLLKSEDAVSVNTNGSAKDASLVTSAPCHNFRALITVTAARTLNEQFQGVKSAAELDLAWKSVRQVFAHWDELMGAYKTATTELKRAIDSQGPAKAKAKGKAKAKAGAKNKGSRMYEVFGAGSSAATPIAKYDTWPVPAEHDMSKPFLLETAPPLLKNVLGDGGDDVVAGVRNELSTFESKFSKSDLRFTAGKAQRRMDEKSGAALAECASSLLSNHTVLDVGKWQPPSCYATIQKHRSLQYEVGHVVLADPLTVMHTMEALNNKKKEDERDRVTYASAPPFLTHAEAEDLEDLAGKGALFCGRLEPGQVLYTPAAMVAGEAIHDSDHVGLKTSLIAVGPGDGDKTGIAALRAMQMEAKDCGKKSETLDDLVTAIDDKISSMKGPPHPPPADAGNAS
ncbi:Uncharacterized protein SCF082_LOCUS28197 [Durusdinium trenchii]|uniref:Uncharacterized protein n=1 Tax=Durusdinium trenchii TaxID=1381693 RepID=A0ABP0MIP1_9DINO